MPRSGWVRNWSPYTRTGSERQDLEGCEFAAEGLRKSERQDLKADSLRLGAALIHTLNCAVSSGQQTFGAPFATQAGADP